MPPWIESEFRLLPELKRREGEEKKRKGKMIPLYPDTAASNKINNKKKERIFFSLHLFATKPA
jgi:hypothetical protein